MNNLSLIELYQMKWRMVKENLKDDELMLEILYTIQNKETKILEDTSATGGLSVGGMGAVVSSQPSGLAGATIGTNWASGGGTEGSGDISIPYNPSGVNRVFHKQPLAMGKDHGPRTGKKSREKKLDLKALKSVFAKRQDFTAGQSKNGEKKVMNFDDFKNSDITTIKK